ncbi:MAG TPA: serine/threonine-protein kinase [Rhodanobacteraceae bacterium]|nr:serine/threonine-protein kinase [Rhodanobacteraceae bacterium]
MDRQHVAALFEQAIEVAPAERAVWLAAACVDDSALRARIEHMLRIDAEAANFLETPPNIVTEILSPATARPEMPGQFGAWRVLRSIGTGGMGEVWLAERSDAEFEQRGAVKQVAYPTPGLLQRFRQERQILARLEHPNIARLIDGGVDAAGAPYLVMDYVEGVPITDFAPAHALDLRRRLRLFLRVCDAVQYAHQNLVVHRDLKPSNILVTADGEPKLLDFGIAKVLATTDQPAATRTLARLLTPDYAAPEQFSGGAITTATDVYALGVVLYELLAGVRPRRVAPVDVETAEHTLDIPPPSAALDRTTGATHRRALRGDLDRVVLTALAPDPQRRYPSAAAFAGDIRRYLDGHPITARRDSAVYRSRKFLRRNRYAVAAGLFVFAILIGATAISLHQAQLARAQARRAAATQQFMSAVFAEANPDENKGQPISARQLLEKGEQQLARMNGAQPVLQIDAAVMLANLYRDMGDFTHAESLLKRALAGLGDPEIPDDVRGSVLVSMATLEAEHKGDFDAGLAHARQGLAALESIGERNWEEIATAKRIIALCLIRRGEDEAAIALLRKAIPLHQRMLDGQPSEALANESVLLGVALGDMARFDEAEVAFERGAAMLRTLYGGDSTRYGYALNEQAGMLYAKGDLARAETLHREVVRIDLERLGPDHVNTLNSTYNLLGDIEKQGRIAEALPQRIALLDRMLASDQESPADKANQYDAVAIDYRAIGRFAESEAMARKALAMLAATHAQDIPNTARYLRHVALAVAFQGRYTEAETLFRDALTLRLKRGTPTSFAACGLRRDIGSVLAQQHRYPEAIVQLQALTKDACMVGLSETDGWRPKALADLSQAQLDNGDTAVAHATATQALEYGHKALQDSYLLGIPLFAMARADLALERAAAAEPLLRQALALRSAVHPANDPRVLEVKVSLINALKAQRKDDEARALMNEIEPLLQESSTPYAADLRARLISI